MDIYSTSKYFLLIHYSFIRNQFGFKFFIRGPGWPSGLGSSTLQTTLTYHRCRPSSSPALYDDKQGCARLACDKVYQLLAQGRWFSPGTLASSTTKTGRHDIAERLLQ